MLLNVCFMLLVLIHGFLIEVMTPSQVILHKHTSPQIILSKHYSLIKAVKVRCRINGFGSMKSVRWTQTSSGTRKSQKGMDDIIKYYLHLWKCT